MPKENNNIVPVLDALNNVSGETGDKKVDKNIIESDARQGGRKSTKKKDPNSGGEKIYFTKIATIFGETFKKINKPKDTAIETDIEGEPESPVEKATQLAMPKMEKKKKGMLAVMAGILLAVGTLAFFLHDQLSPVFRFLSKAIFKIIPVFKSLWHIFGTMIKGTKVFQKVLGWFKPILGIIGKATSAIKALPGGGGLLKLLAGIGAKVGKTLLKVLKFIPYIGAVINFGFAFAKFKKGDWVGGIMEIIAGILGLLPPPLPILGMIMDGIILVRDMKMSKKKKEGDAGGEAKQGILGSIGKKVGGWLLTILEFLPVIGTAILAGKAVFAFTKGNLKGGFIYLGRALLSLVPGAGLLIKGIGFMISLFAGKKKEKEKDAPKETGTLGKIAKKVGGFLLSLLEFLPVIGTAILGGKAIFAFLKGDIKGGFIYMGRALLALIPGAPFLAKGIGWLVSLFAGKKEKKPELETDKGPGIMGKIVGWISKKIGGFIGGIWDAIWGIIKGIWTAIKTAADWLLKTLVLKPAEMVGELMKFFGKIATIVLSIPGKIIDILISLVKGAFNIAKKIPFIGPLLSAAEELFDEGAGEASSEAKKKDKDKKPQKIQGVQLEYIAKLNRSQLSVLVNVKQLLEQINQTLKTGSMGHGQSAPPEKLNFLQKFLKEEGDKFKANIAGGNEPVNNDGVVHDSRSAYNLSPYSINVPA